jgi:hypothetical protein
MPLERIASGNLGGVLAGSSGRLSPTKRKIAGHAVDRSGESV